MYKKNLITYQEMVRQFNVMPFKKKTKLMPCKKKNVKK